MSIQKATDVYERLTNIASKFLSPSFNSYFNKRADLDYNRFRNEYPKNKSIAESYIREQTELADSLDRTVGIYNMYRDENSTL